MWTDFSIWKQETLALKEILYTCWQINKTHYFCPHKSTLSNKIIIISNIFLSCVFLSFFVVGGQAEAHTICATAKILGHDSICGQKSLKSLKCNFVNLMKCFKIWFDPNFYD